MYDKFNSPESARHHYRRCRKTKYFIINKDNVKKLNPVCSECGKRLSEHDDQTESEKFANRCEYYPRSKKIAIMNYVCAWNKTLNNAYRLGVHLV